MPVTTEEPNTTAMTQTTSSSSSSSSMTMMIDEIYEFSAPRFFDFIKDESDEDKNKAELWFDSALTYAPSRKILYPSSPFIVNLRFFSDLSFLDCSFVRFRDLGFLLWIRLPRSE